MDHEEILFAWREEVAKKGRKWEINANIRAEAEEMAKWYNQEEKWCKEDPGKSQSCSCPIQRWDDHPGHHAAARHKVEIDGVYLSAARKN